MHARQQSQEQNSHLVLHLDEPGSEPGLNRGDGDEGRDPDCRRNAEELGGGNETRSSETAREREQ